MEPPTAVPSLLTVVTRPSILCQSPISIRPRRGPPAAAAGDASFGGTRAYRLCQGDRAADPHPSSRARFMGKNGSRKSTLTKVLVGNPHYKVTGGTILFKGENLIDMEPEERSIAGLCMSFQAPIEVPGLSNYDSLLMALNARR